MKIDFDQVLKDPKDEDFHAMPGAQDVLKAVIDVHNEDPMMQMRFAVQKVQEKVAELRGEPRTLADVCYEALTRGTKAEKGSSKDKMVRAKLAAQICQGGVIDLAEADKQLIEQEIGEFCTALLVWACDQAMSTPAEEAEEAKPNGKDTSPEALEAAKEQAAAPE